MFDLTQLNKSMLMFAEALENYAKATQASMLALQKIAALNHEINMTASKMFIKDDQ